MYKKIFLTCSILSGIALFGAGEAQSEDLDSILQEASTIATKKSLNVDYMPSVVTVIDAQTFIDAGVQNVSQALDMLPGFQEQVSPMGYTISTVRGFKNPNGYFADKIKILVDGVAINNEITGTASFYLDFPMRLIQKIEVLRGPASTMYGGGAYYGAVNIITKLGSSKQNNQYYISGGSYGTITAGTELSTTQNGWNIYADGYAYSNNKAIPFPEQGGNTDEATKDYSVGFKANKENWELLTRLKHETSGNYYSFEGTLNPIPNKPENHSNIYFFSQLKYNTKFDGYESETKLNYSHRNESINANIKSVSDMSGSFSSVGINTVNEGFYWSENITEDNYGFETTLSFPQIASNDILLGAGANYNVVSQDNFDSSLENAILQNNPSSLQYNSNFDYNGTAEPAFWENLNNNGSVNMILPKNISRTNSFAYAQDLISLTENMDMILGLRLDYISDIGAQLSKRLGLVYRAGDKTTLKLLYGSAYRAPTLIEKYALGHINLRMGDNNLKPENCDTYEAALVYLPDFSNKLSLNFYYTKLHNVIDLEELKYTDIGYTQYPDRTSKGVEFEYFYKTSMKHNLYFNLSYTDTTYITPMDTHNGNQDNNLVPPDPSITESMPDISRFMAKALYIYKPNDKLTFGTAWRYFSQTTKPNTLWVVMFNSDTPVRAQSIFDETVSYMISPSTSISATIKNIFNEPVFNPAYYYYTNGGVPREGRNFLFTFSQTF